jgi:hypothetical protein
MVFSLLLMTSSLLLIEKIRQLALRSHLLASAFDDSRQRFCYLEFSERIKS